MTTLVQPVQISKNGALKRSAKSSSLRGFTLVEVLVVLAMSAVIMSLTWRAMSGVMMADERLSEQTPELLQLDAGLSALRADLDASSNRGLASEFHWRRNVLALPMGAGVWVGWAIDPSHNLRRVEAKVDQPAPASISMRDAERAKAETFSHHVRLIIDARQAQQATPPVIDQKGSFALINDTSVMPVEFMEVSFFRDRAWVSPSSDAIETPPAPLTAKPQAGMNSIAPQSTSLQRLTPDGLRLVLHPKGQTAKDDQQGYEDAWHGPLTILWGNPLIVGGPK